MANIHGLVATDDFVEYSYDPATGIREWIRVNDDDTVTLRATQDVDAILDATTRECAMTEKSTPYGDIARVASIPMTMLHDPNLGLRQNDPAAVKKFLNDRDFSKFRTRVGQV
jgi:DUF917 family protein